MKFYAIDEDQLAKLRAVAKRLYTEDRLDGDGMRDLAHNDRGRHAGCRRDRGTVGLPAVGPGSGVL